MEIREIKNEDISEIKSLYKKNLWFLDYFLFSEVFGSIVKLKEKGRGTCFVALEQNEVVGSFCVSWFMIKSEKHGLIDCVVTQKDLYGKGIARSLLHHSIKWLKDQGCAHIYATVEHYNSRSWNMFIHNGFSLYEFPQQLKDLGIRTFKLWSKEGYFFGIGTYFLKLNETELDYKTSSPIYHNLMGWFGLFLPWIIIMLIESRDFMLVPYVAIITVLSIFFHEFGHWFIAKMLKINTCFKANEPGILVSSIIALIGGIYPFYGSTYIKQKDWSYIGDKRKPGLNKNGPIYVMGPLFSIIMAIISKYLIGLTFGYWQIMFQLGMNINIYLVLFNLIPIKSAGGFPWDGTKIYQWNKIIWVIETIVMILIVILLW